MVQDVMILEPFPSFESSMSYFFLLLVVLFQLFLAAHVFYLALSPRDFACVVPCTLLLHVCSSNGGGLGVVFVCSGSAPALGFPPRDLLDLRVFSILDVCPRPGRIERLEDAIGLLAYEKGGHVYARALRLTAKSFRKLTRIYSLHFC